jgi:hypothetical protein
MENKLKLSSGQIKQVQDAFKEFLAKVTLEKGFNRQCFWMGCLYGSKHAALQWDENNLQPLLQICKELIPNISRDTLVSAFEELMVVLFTKEVGQISDDILGKPLLSYMKLVEFDKEFTETMTKLDQSIHTFVELILIEGLELAITELPLGLVIIKPVDSELRARLREFNQRMEEKGHPEVKIETWEGAKCYCSVVVEGESRYALNEALRQVREAILVINFFVKRITEFNSRISVTGCRASGRQETLAYCDNHTTGGRDWLFFGTGINIVPFTVDAHEYARYRQIGLDKLNLYTHETNSQTIGQRILRAVHWYGRAVDAESMEERFVSLCIAIESLLIGIQGNINDINNGSITQNLGERCAYLLGHDFEQRKTIYRDIKRLYGIRSKIVHDGSSVQLVDLSKIGYYAFRVIVAYMDLNLSTFDEFAQWLLAQKFIREQDHETSEHSEQAVL